MNQTHLTGKATVDMPWMQYYPEFFKSLTVPTCTLTEYLKQHCPGPDVDAIDFYGSQIKWSTIFEQADVVARSLKAMGLQEGDQLPIFLASVPEFFMLLLAAEKLGVSLLARDNTLEENLEAVNKSGAKVIIAHDYFKQHELERYLAETHVERIVLLDACNSCDRSALPDYIAPALQKRYEGELAHGPKTLDWQQFLALGHSFDGPVEAPVDIDRPLFRVYTSGSTGPSKQVIHSAHTTVGVLSQMNFYGNSDERPTWMVSVFAPTLVATIISMMLMPMASNRLLVLSPFCEPQDIDLDLMRRKPNTLVLIPMLLESIMRNGRVPDDYDMSHLTVVGVGSESFNNNQLMRGEKFLLAHGSPARLTTGYGSSEAGSNAAFHMTPHPVRNGNVGIPMPLNVMGIFQPGTQNELSYDEIGELCISGPGIMLGYDSPEATAKALQVHADGRKWLHTGDIGYITAEGIVHVLTRGSTPRYGGGDLATLPMENLVADANIEGIDDEFFVVAPDLSHPGYFVPYLYVVLDEGYTVEDIESDVRACLEEHMQPLQIIAIPERPFFHFKTNRIGLATRLLSERVSAAQKKQ